MYCLNTHVVYCNCADIRIETFLRREWEKDDVSTMTPGT
jgi:hypothetical protein